MKQGSRLLQVTGILNIIGGGLSIVLAVLALVAALALLGGVGAMIILAAVAVTLIAAVVQLVAGILGAKNWQQPDKAMPCIIFGIIIIVMVGISTIMNLFSGTGLNYFSLVLGLALPILYLIGAFQLKGMAGQAAAMPPPVAPQDPQAPQGPTA